MVKRQFKKPPAKHPKTPLFNENKPENNSEFGPPDALTAVVGGCNADRQTSGSDPTLLLGARVEGFAGRHDAGGSSPDSEIRRRSN